MISPITIITLSSLAAAALAGDVIQIYRNNPVNHTAAFKFDQTRWREQVSAPAGTSIVPLTNTIFSYMIDLKLGSTKQLVTVVLDTGSTVLWVASNKCPEQTCGKPKESFNPSKSKTFKKTKQPLQIQYGSGSVQGYFGTDTISISPKLTFKGSIGVATAAQGILSRTTDGIMGLRPPESGEVPTVVDELRSAHLIGKSVISVYFQPLPKKATISVNGELSIGSIDTSKVNGAITYFPITKVQPASLYWGFDHTGLYSGKKLLHSKGTGILDTGTSLIMLDSKIGKAFFKNIPGAKIDPQTGLYSYPCSGLKKYPSFSITLGGRRFTLTAEEYTAPTDLMAELGGPKGSNICESWISLGDTGFDLILGQKFLEFYVSVYDTDKLRMGLGEAVNRAARNAHVKA